MPSIYSLENKLENSRKQFCIESSKCGLIKGEFVPSGKQIHRKIIETMAKAQVEPLLVDKVNQSNVL